MATSTAKAVSKGEKAGAKPVAKPAENPPASPNKVDQSKPAANENDFHPKAANDNTPPATSNAQHERYKEQLRKDMEKPHVEDPELKDIMEYAYRRDAKVGSGSTAAAIREEAKTGGQVGGRTHSKKGKDVMNSLENWMNKKQANDNNFNPYKGDPSTRVKPSDMDAAKNVYLDTSFRKMSEQNKQVITPEHCIDLLIQKFPQSSYIFQRALQPRVEDDTSDQIIEPPPTIFRQMNKFSSYVSKLLKNNQEPHFVKEVFISMEYLLANGDEDVKDAVATCFLENILNVTPQEIQPNNFVPYLGKLSRDYCRAWDSFTGVYTEGLWNDESPQKT